MPKTAALARASRCMVARMNATQNDVPRRAYSVGEAAQSLGICRRTVYELMERGQLSTITLGRRRLVPVSELERLVRPARAAA